MAERVEAGEAVVMWQQKGQPKKAGKVKMAAPISDLLFVAANVNCIILFKEIIQTVI